LYKEIVNELSDDSEYQWNWFSGCTIGSIVTMPISGLLTKYDFDGGWPAVFYSFGKSNTLQKNFCFHAFKITSIYFRVAF